MLSLLIAFLCGYLAYRVIRGGLRVRSLNRLDIFVIALLVLITLYSLELSMKFSFSF